MYALFLSRIQWANCADIEETERRVPLFPSLISASVLQGKSQRRPRPCLFWHPPPQYPVWFLVGGCYQFQPQPRFRMWVSIFFIFFVLSVCLSLTVLFHFTRAAEPSRSESDVSLCGRHSVGVAASPHGKCGSLKNWWDPEDRLRRQPELAGNLKRQICVRT